MSSQAGGAMASRLRWSFPLWLVLWLVCCLGVVATTRADGPDAWANDLSPIAAGDWNGGRSAHLLERAGFGGTPEEIARFAALTPVQAVDRLVDYESIDNSALAPFD